MNPTDRPPADRTPAGDHAARDRLARSRGFNRRGPHGADDHPARGLPCRCEWSSAWYGDTCPEHGEQGHPIPGTEAAPPVDAQPRPPWAGLPPGPWTAWYAEGDPETVLGVHDATGAVILAGTEHSDMNVVPAVLRAVCALPSLVAAARDIVGRYDGLEPRLRAEYGYVRREVEALRATLALAAIDGEGRADG